MDPSQIAKMSTRYMEYMLPALPRSDVPEANLLAKRDPNARIHKVTGAAAKKLRRHAPPRQEEVEEQQAQVKKLDPLARFYSSLFQFADMGYMATAST